MRLRLATPLPLRIGDRLLLRDPGTRRVLGADVRDVDPPELRRRGAARQRAAELAAQPAGAAGAAADLARRRVVRADDFAAMGWPVPADATVASGRGCWPPGWPTSSPRRVPGVVAALPEVAPARARPAGRGGAPASSSCRTPSCVPAARPAAAGAARGPGRRRRGRAAAAGAAGGRRRSAPGWPPTRSPPPRPATWSPPGWASRELAAAVRSGQLVRIADGVYLAPGIAEEARARLAASPQPFTLSQARQAWGTSRRVAVPLAEWLDAQGVTVRLPDNTRRLRSRSDASRPRGSMPVAVASSSSSGRRIGVDGLHAASASRRAPRPGPSHGPGRSRAACRAVLRTPRPLGKPSCRRCERWPDLERRRVLLDSGAGRSLRDPRPRAPTRYARSAGSSGPLRHVDGVAARGQRRRPTEPSSQLTGS